MATDSLIFSEGMELSLSKQDPYAEALAVWLEGKSSNTRRSYAAVMRDFFDYVGKHPDSVTATDVAQWKEFLKRERADSTVAQRLSIVSSYYVYLIKNRVGLQDHNPVDGVERMDLDVDPYGRSRKLSLDGFKAILAQINDETAMGARDVAILLFYVLSARRRSEIVGLRGRDIKIEGGRVMYHVRLKRGKSKWKQMPPPVWEAIQRYLKLSGRELENDGPIFTATVDSGDILRDYYGAPHPEEDQPLTGEAILQALRRYARRAKLDDSEITLHSLRHLGALLFKEASGDILETQEFLDHKHLNTTQIYLQQLEGDEHRHWQEMYNHIMEQPRKQP